MQNSKSKAGSTRVDRMAVFVLSMVVTLIVAMCLIKFAVVPFLDTLNTLNTTLDQAGQFLCGTSTTN